MHINFYPIHFQFDSFEVLTTPYTEDELSRLRKQFNETHSFFRREDLIYISNKSGTDGVVQGTPKKIDLYADHHVTSSLIKHIFFRTFKERFPEYIPLDFYPFRLLTRKPAEDLLFPLLPEELQGVIGYKKLIEVQLRQTLIQEKLNFGFVINIQRNWVFNRNCEELYNEGFNLIGVEVLHSETFLTNKNVVAPNDELVGELHSIQGENAIVVTNEGQKSFPLKELSIRKNKHNIGNYLTHALSAEQSEKILLEVKSKREEISNPKSHFNEINRIASFLFGDQKEDIVFSNKDGFCFTVSKIPLEVSNSIELKTPSFIFDPGATKTNTIPDLGLSQFGPYDSGMFDNKTPKVLAICHSNIRGRFSSFLHNLKDGIPNSQYFKKGLQKKYDLQDIQIQLEEISDYSLKCYIDAISKNVESRPSLAILEIPEKFKYDKIHREVYTQLKAKLLSLEIPVQIVTTHIINSHNEYILNSIALQIYAKIGGTPWVLPVQLSIDKEIVIGIGHSWLRDNQYSGANSARIVGITTFLSSDGQYLLSDKVKDVRFEEYFNELLVSLRKSIQTLSVSQGWENGETVRLIFHIFKPIKNTEFEVISALISEFPQFKIRFAFVTISKKHPLMLFDKNQDGFKVYNSPKVKGEFVPLRGSNYFLDDSTCVVQMLGGKELKTSKQGMSSPILIKIRTPQGNGLESNIDHLLFHDLTYITRQIFAFTYLSWRSFLPGEEPATMKYSHLISNLLGKMRSIPTWDPDKLNYSLKRKKWFL